MFRAFFVCESIPCYNRRAKRYRGATLARDSKTANAGAESWREREAERKAAKTRAKEEARQARNAAQAEEESRTWKEVRERADLIVKAKSPIGRPPYVWTDAIEHEILERLSNGQSLTLICAMPHMPTTPTVYKRLEQSPSFAFGYSRARENMGSVLFDQCLEIADDDSRDVIETPEGPQVNHAAIQRDKIRIETRFRMAAKFNAALSEKALPASVTVNHNTVQIDGRTLDVAQRDQLRTMLLEARASMAKPVED